MKHTFEQKVSYCDTDAYKVVWHGAYLRWLEVGRIHYCDMMGLDLIKLQEQDLLLPVVNVNMRYKASAKLGDNLIIETVFQKYSKFTVTFLQKISHKETGKLFVEATVEAAPVNSEGKLYRRMPELLKEACEKYAEEQCV